MEMCHCLMFQLEEWVVGVKDQRTEVSFRHREENGFEYVISFIDGYVLLKTKGCGDEIFEMRMATEDWVRLKRCALS